MSSDTVPFLRDPAFRDFLQQVRQTNNWTNWLYIARSWLFILVVLAAAVVGLEWVRQSGVGWGWAVPIVVASAILVGAGQHHLGVLGHEGSHRTLFRNRWLNELASDWLCMYPLFSTTYFYRLQHLAHHQFVNDPERDPNVVQMRDSDTWPSGPLRPRQVLRYVLGLMSPARFFGFLRVRIKDNSFVSRNDVYRVSDAPTRTWPKRLGAVLVVGQLVLNLALVRFGDWLLLAIVPGSVFLVSLVIYAVMPEGYYHRSRVKPDMTLRSTTLQRFTYYFALFHGLAWVTVLTGVPALWYWLLLWAVPLVLVFPLYVILRQFVQHSNGGRGRLTNTRVFLGPATMNFFLMPVGQDYHLPHHLFASVPHYKLRALHEALMQYPEYRASVIEVDGVVKPPAGSEHKTVLDVLGGDPELAVDGTFIDSSVLDEHEVSEREAIEEEERASAGAPQSLVERARTRTDGVTPASATPAGTV
jgi:fatty acid desaturase